MTPSCQLTVLVLVTALLAFSEARGHAALKRSDGGFVPETTEAAGTLDGNTGALHHLDALAALADSARLTGDELRLRAAAAWARMSMELPDDEDEDEAEDDKGAASTPEGAARAASRHRHRSLIEAARRVAQEYYEPPSPSPAYGTYWPYPAPPPGYGPYGGWMPTPPPPAPQPAVVPSYTPNAPPGYYSTPSYTPNAPPGYSTPSYTPNAPPSYGSYGSYTPNAPPSYGSYGSYAPNAPGYGGYGGYGDAYPPPLESDPDSSVLGPDGTPISNDGASVEDGSSGSGSKDDSDRARTIALAVILPCVAALALGGVAYYYYHRKRVTRSGHYALNEMYDGREHDHYRV